PRKARSSLLAAAPAWAMRDLRHVISSLTGSRGANMRALRGASIPVSAQAALTLKIRIEKDICRVSVDSSGAPLHKRGYKTATGKAPLRETMAALFLRACDYRPGEPVIDPTCGSGTIPIEAAEIAAGFAPGRNRSFAFERLPSFNPARFSRPSQGPDAHQAPIFGYDRDDGAIRAARKNAKAAGVACYFERRALSDLAPPRAEPGLVLCNPPYGARIGDAKALVGLYATLGEALKTRFKGWRVGIVTSEARLAQATGLPFEPKGAPIDHGGLKVWLFRTGPL
ncbi:MAG: hypothetical protein AAF841_13925, partial [Pseudomonadota bacterium]